MLACRIINTRFTSPSHTHLDILSKSIRHHSTGANTTQNTKICTHISIAVFVVKSCQLRSFTFFNKTHANEPISPKTSLVHDLTGSNGQLLDQ